MENKSLNTQSSEQEPRAFLIWDTCLIAQHQADFLREEDPELSEDEAFSQACEDPFLYETEWDYLIECLGEKMGEINGDGFWLVKVSNFGWRNLDGWKKFQTEDAKEFLNKILPDTDCTFHIFECDDAQGGGKMLAIRNWHHDSPMGNEWYYARPISAAKFYDEDEEGDDE